MSNNAPDYNDNLVFPPQMPLCDIEELKQKIKNLKELLKECHFQLLNKPIREIQYDIKMAEHKDLLKRIYEAIND